LGKLDKKEKLQTFSLLVINFGAVTMLIFRQKLLIVLLIFSQKLQHRWPSGKVFRIYGTQPETAASLIFSQKCRIADIQPKTVISLVLILTV